MKYDANNLRTVMFEAIDLLRKGEITADQARAMSELGKVVIDSAKTEVEYAKVNGGGVVTFFEELPEGVSERTIVRIK